MLLALISLQAGVPVMSIDLLAQTRERCGTKAADEIVICGSAIDQRIPPSSDAVPGPLRNPTAIALPGGGVVQLEPEQVQHPDGSIARRLNVTMRKPF